MRAMERVRAVRLARALTVEALVLGILLLAYRWVRYLADGQVTVAKANAIWLWGVERVMALPTETELQHWVFSVEPVIVKAANVYYVWAHFPVTAMVFFWLFVWFRPAYPRVRAELVLLTVAGLLLHVLFPLAPPRLMPDFGTFDTMLLIGPSAYPAESDGIANQFAAMPSLHVGWALLVAIAVTRVLDSPLRWLAWLHPALTMAVVVVTANHYWLDALVAAALLAMAITDRKSVV